jgi:hypothetical protein
MLKCIRKSVYIDIDCPYFFLYVLNYFITIEFTHKLPAN